MNHSINLNLLKFNHCGVMNLTGKTGTKRCIVIPIADNHFVEGEKGVYVNLSAWEHDGLSDNRTHLVKQSLPKEVLDKMTDDEKRALPILGDIRSFNKLAVTEDSYQVPEGNEKNAPF